MRRIRVGEGLGIVGAEQGLQGGVNLRPHDVRIRIEQHVDRLRGDRVRQVRHREAAGRGNTRAVEHDVLYIPRGAAYVLEEPQGQTKIIVCRAPASQSHPVFHGKWNEFSKDEKRIRHLKGKDVFLMFDVSETADKLIAGFTLFQPHQRSWPPHNHTDQEEIYVFTRGRGSMEVYADEETKSFVRSVGEGDAVTIPILNYHPVFSQEDELHFIWCIAGNRYWVGDKNKDFMAGKVDKLTT